MLHPAMRSDMFRYVAGLITGPAALQFASFVTPVVVARIFSPESVGSLFVISSIARIVSVKSCTSRFHDTSTSWGMSNAWLSVARFDSSNFVGAANRIREPLDANNIESRPVWKPMHQQPVYARDRNIISGASDALFVEGLCLPSGSVMDEEQVNRVSQIVANGLRM